MIIDYQQLSADALEGVCREYIISQLNESDSEIALGEWIEKVKRKVLTGELLIEFSEVDESVTLKRPEDIVPVGTDSVD